MGKLRKDPSKRHPDTLPQPEDIGAGEHGAGDDDDFDSFLATLDDSDSSEDEADPSQEDIDDADTSDDNDDDEDMEPEEEQDLNEDEDEDEPEEEEEEDTEENTDDQEEDHGEEEEGEEDIPIQNGIGGGNQSPSEEEDDGEPEELSVKKHKMDLQKLQDTDPEFFAFLKENDSELLDFNDSEEDGEGEDDDDDEDSDSEEEEQLHKPPEVLEEASDSEAEEERLDETSKEHKSTVEKNLKKGVVDINVISHWQTQLSSTRDITVLTSLIEALQCAVHSLSEGDSSEAIPKWRVDGSANFNALLRLCIKEVKGFCVRFLCGNNNVAQSEAKFDQKPLDIRDKCKNKWVRLRPKIKSYMEIIVQLFKCMGNPEAITAVLRHTLRMSGFWALMASKSFKLMRALTNIWSQGEDSCRVLSFLTIIRIAGYNKEVFLLHMFKQMYISYVANCKFTSVNTWPAINFMRSSLVEIYLLDAGLAYGVAFPFVRQLAIHLRNALSPDGHEGNQKKSEASRVVYSWQFVHSLHLWADVLAQAGTMDDENLKLLIYPVVQICNGTIKLIPTKKYIPIRFHIVRMLIKLQEKTGVFIPVLPLITEVLRLTDFSSKSASKFSVRPIDLTCCLKAEPSESGYLKAVSENAFETILAYCKAIGTNLGFPEIVTPTVMYLKSFLKKQCKNAEVAKKFKVLLEKIELNSKYISTRRSKALEDGTVTLADRKSHKILQVQMETSKPHPPILEYASEYFKVHQKVQLQARKPPMETREERLIPKPQVLKGPGPGQSKKRSNKPMFDSDDDDDDDLGEDGDEGEFMTKLDHKVEAEFENQKKSKKKNKRKIAEVAVEEDAVEVDVDEAEVNKVAKKKKMKKGKALKLKEGGARTNESFANVQDELVDFRFSDDED